MKNRVIILYITFLIFKSLNAQNNWEPTNGPYGGNCNGLKLIKNEIFATTNCGIYSTIDNGLTWNNKCSGLGGEFGGCKMIKDIEEINNVLIASTWEDGIFISTDYGKSWKASNNGLTNPFLDYKIYDMTTIGSDILIGTLNGIYISKNNGLSWKPSNIGISENGNINAIKFAKIESTIFIGTQSDIYKSTDNGFTWKDLNLNIKINAFNLVALGSNLYTTGNNGEGLYKSVDKGLTWSIINTNLPSNLFDLFSHGTNLYCNINKATYKSTDGGYKWTNDPSKYFSSILETGNKTIVSNGFVYGWNNSDLKNINLGLGGADSTNVLFLDDETLYSGSNNGIYKTSDGGNSWVNIGLTLPLNTKINCITKCNKNLIIGTKENGIYYSKDEGINWTPSNTGLSLNNIFYNYITTIFNYKGRLFIGARENKIFHKNASLFISDDNGMTWKQSATGLGQNFNVSSICNYNNFIIIGTKDEGVYLSNDNGESWLFDGNSESVNSVCSDSSNIFVANASKISTTSDLGNSWKTLDINGYNIDNVKTIANINNSIYALQYNGIWNYKNGNWSNISTSGLEGVTGRGIISDLKGNIFIGANGHFKYNDTSIYTLKNGVSKLVNKTNELVEFSKDVINIYPNPFSDIFSISSAKILVGQDFLIYDNGGKIVYKGEISQSSCDIDLKHLKTGIYYLKFETESMKPYKIIKL